MRYGFEKSGRSPRDGARRCATERSAVVAGRAICLDRPERFSARKQQRESRWLVVGRCGAASGACCCVAALVSTSGSTSAGSSERVKARCPASPPPAEPQAWAATAATSRGRMRPPRWPLARRGCRWMVRSRSLACRRIQTPGARRWCVRRPAIAGNIWATWPQAAASARASVRRQRSAISAMRRRAAPASVAAVAVMAAGTASRARGWVGTARLVRRTASARASSVKPRATEVGCVAPRRAMEPVRRVRRRGCA